MSDEESNEQKLRIITILSPAQGDDGTRLIVVVFSHMDSVCHAVTFAAGRVRPQG